MNKKQLQREHILNHGFDLQRIYPDSKRFGPVELCKKLHRLEVRAHRMAEEMCCVDVNHEKALDRIEKRANEILGSGPHVFINQDPRGYALKIETTKREVRQEGRSIYKDTDNIKFNYQTLEELLSMEIIPNNETDRLRAFFIKE